MLILIMSYLIISLIVFAFLYEDSPLYEIEHFIVYSIAWPIYTLCLPFKVIAYLKNWLSNEK